MCFTQNSSRLGLSNYSSFLVRFWGWTENEREAAMDLAQLRDRAQKGLPLYGQSDQPEWIQQAAHSNSAFSQLKFCMSVRLNDRICAYLLSPAAFPMFVFFQASENISLTEPQAQPRQSPTSWYGRVPIQTMNTLVERYIPYMSTLGLVSACFAVLHPHSTACRSPSTCGQRFATLCR